MKGNNISLLIVTTEDSGTAKSLFFESQTFKPTANDSESEPENFVLLRHYCIIIEVFDFIMVRILVTATAWHGSI